MVRCRACGVEVVEAASRTSSLDPLTSAIVTQSTRAQAPSAEYGTNVGPRTRQSRGSGAQRGDARDDLPDPHEGSARHEAVLPRLAFAGETLAGVLQELAPCCPADRGHDRGRLETWARRCPRLGARTSARRAA